MSCRFASSLIAAYVEGQLDPARRWVVRRHLLACTACYEDYERSEAVGDLVERVGPRVVPSDLHVQIMSAVSRQSVRYQWLRWKYDLRNLMRPIAVPAAGGLLSAVVLFGILMSGLAASGPGLNSDIPITYFATTWVTDPSLRSPPPFGIDKNVVVEAFVDGRGAVYDFRVVRLPTTHPADHTKLKSDLAHVLLTATIDPATIWGQPVRGKMLISFQASTQVIVRG